MRTLGVHLAMALGVAAVSAAFLAPATARADDYAGQTYGDALGAIKDAGKKAVIATRSGNAVANDDCLVTHSQPALWLKGNHFTQVKNTVLVDLNCNAKVATAAKAGNSAASPEGRAALAEQKKNVAKKAEKPTADQADAQHG